MQLTIGICTVSTRPENYLLGTIESLLTNSTDAERRQFHIVVQSGDPEPGDSEQIAEVKRAFSSEIASGLLTLAKTQPSDYPEFQPVQTGVADDRDRVVWRTKQCVDFALQFDRCAHYADLYLHLEDDILCAPGYFGKLMRLVEQSGENWSTIRFCELGSVAVLFKRRDLQKLARYLRLFCDEAPVDWLIESWTDLRARMLQPTITCPRALFQHVGLYSSLPGKVLPLVSKTFQAGDNETASGGFLSKLIRPLRRRRRSA